MKLKTTGNITNLYVRFSKIILVWCIGIFALIICINNILDYQANFQFVIHVLKMDTTFPDNPLKWRAIDSSLIHHIAYALIIIAEGAIATLCLVGGWRLLSAVREVAQFNAAKNTAILGLTAGILLWFFGFIVIAGEWFLMWQSTQWNGTQAAFRITVMFGMILIYLNMPDRGNDE